MLYRQNLYFIVVSLALSFSSLPSGASDTYDQKMVLEAIKTKMIEGVEECDPFLDPGCTLPEPKAPPGCSDCIPSQLSSAFILDQKFALPDSIYIGDKKLELFKDPNEQDYPIFLIPAEIGL